MGLAGTHHHQVAKSLSPVTLLLHNGLMNKLAMGAWMEVTHGLSNMGLYLLRLIWLWPLLSTQSSSTETNTESLIWYDYLG